MGVEGDRCVRVCVWCRRDPGAWLPLTAARMPHVSSPPLPPPQRRLQQEDAALEASNVYAILENLPQARFQGREGVV